MPTATKTYLITGGNSGLGLETARRLAAAGARVILGCRSEQKGQAAAAALRRQTGNSQVEARCLDLASLASVRQFAAGLQGVTLDGLDNNAGVAGTHTGLTVDGMDVVFQSNHLGHFLLTNLLLPQLAADGRILNIASDMHDPPDQQLVWRGVGLLAHPDETVQSQRYYYSKLCNLYFTYELARRLQAAGSKITVNALNPGFMGDTNLAGGRMTPERIEYVRRTMPSRYGELPTSAQAAADLLSAPSFAGKTALYYDRSTNAAPSSALSYSTANAQELWEASCKLAGLT